MKEVQLEDGLWIGKIKSLEVGVQASLGTSEIRYASACRCPRAGHDQDPLGITFLDQVRDALEIWTVRTFERPARVVALCVPHLEVKQTTRETQGVATANQRCRTQEVQ